jgi:hypothetical protein
LKSFLGLGELTLIGWLTVALYLSTAISCWIMARKLQTAAVDIEDVRELRAWTWITAAFLALGITKLLGLETALTETSRLVARSQGWYSQRQLVQIAFIVVVAVICVIALIIIARWARKASTATFLASTSSMFCVGYVLVRAASFHHVDGIIYTQFFGLRLNWIMEIGGIGIVLVATFARKSQLGTSTLGVRPGS